MGPIEGEIGLLNCPLCAENIYIAGCSHFLVDPKKMENVCKCFMQALSFILQRKCEQTPSEQIKRLLGY